MADEYAIYGKKDPEVKAKTRWKKIEADDPIKQAMKLRKKRAKQVDPWTAAVQQCRADGVIGDDDAKSQKGV